MSIRSLERIYGVNKETIIRYQLLTGQGCAALLDRLMQDVAIDSLQADEFWSFIYKKQQNINPKKKSGYDHEGDIWTYVAIDPETKLVPSFWVGNRERYDARTFMEDLAGRVGNRVQLSTDTLASYADAVDNAFGGAVDYGQIVKSYSSPPLPDGTRGVTGEVVRVTRRPVFGRPIFAGISTSIVEKQNHTARMHVRRIARATNAFSKKLINFKAAIALHYAYYNLVKVHTTLKTTPAVAAKVTDHVWTMFELIEAAGQMLPIRRQGMY
jgi:IS1 family transposase